MIDGGPCGTAFDLQAAVERVMALSRETRQDSAELTGSRLRRLESVQAALVERGLWTSGPSTLYAVLGLTRREVESCRVLGWIMDPLAPHGLGTAVLDQLLGWLEEQAEVASFSRSALAGVQVVTEEARRRSRADLVLYGQGWEIVIEAKLAAAEQPDQGHRLAADWPDAHYVFLTSRGLKMVTGRDTVWTPMRWDTVNSFVRVALLDAKPPPTPEATTARNAVRDYLIATGHLEHDQR